MHTRKGIALVGVKGHIGAQEDKEVPATSTSDRSAPSFEQISLIPSSLLSKNPTLVMFNATDEESGIATYNAIIGGKKIENAQSPLIVNKKIFSYTVFVEAYDLYGNKQIASVIVPGVIGGDRWIWILFLGTLFVLFVRFIIKQYAKK